MDAGIIEKAVAAANEKLGGADLDSSILFDFEGDGGVYVEGGKTPPASAASGGESADCTVIASVETFQELLEGELDPTAAFMTGKLKIDGDMGVAMKLAQLLG